MGDTAHPVEKIMCFWIIPTSCLPQLNCLVCGRAKKEAARLMHFIAKRPIVGCELTIDLKDMISL